MHPTHTIGKYPSIGAYDPPRFRVSILVILKNGALESIVPRTTCHTTGVAFEQVKLQQWIRVQ
jgi:hypothetical protein